MSVHTYVNGDQLSNSDSATARIEINRQNAVITESRNTDVSIERFVLEGFFPLFKVEDDISIGIINISSGIPVYQEIDFSPKSRGGFLYNYRHVAEAVQTALNTLCSALSITDVPEFKFDGFDKFTISTTSAFRGAWQIAMDSKMYRYFNTFDFETSKFPYILYLDQDVEEQKTRTTEFLSPVKRVVLKTNLSVRSEYLPDPSVDNNNNNAVSSSDGQFLVDYRFFQSDGNPLQELFFSASGTNNRWHNVIDGSTVQNFYVTFEWIDVNNNSYPVTLKDGCTASLKCYFSK
tara:strand:- start:40 stop:912 length:873 start_codon:yes stop_codon:yes gene_type:complete